MRILSSIHPTTLQKQVIALVVAASTPKLAADALAGSQNLVAARDLLMKLGVLNFAGGEATLTDTGMNVAKEEGLVDETGQLTDAGRQLIPGAQSAQPAAPAQEAPAPEAGAAPGGEEVGGLPPLESFTYNGGSILQEVIKTSLF